MVIRGSLTSRSRKAVAAVAAVFSICTAGVGLAHMRWARPLLQRLGGCPLGRATPLQVEAAQRQAWHALKGAGRAPARPAMGFVLDRTTLPQLRAWADVRGLACEVQRGGALLRCSHVPAAALTSGGAGVYDDLSFGFRLADQRLVNVTALRTGLAAVETAARLRDIAGVLERELGAPTRQAMIAGGPSFVQYRYADYLAGVTAMELPSRGHAVREHYMSGLD
jgi:hypothetical protein